MGFVTNPTHCGAVYAWITRNLFFAFVAISPFALFFLTYFGYVAPFSGRFYSLYDTGISLSLLFNRPSQPHRLRQDPHSHHRVGI